MRTVSLSFEHNTIAFACGAPGHTMSAVFNANPIGLVLDRLANLFASYTPQKVLLDGEDSAAMAAVETWLSNRGQSFHGMPEVAVTRMTDALTMGATDMDIIDGPALFEICRPGEDRALAALELNHRLSEWSTEQLQRSGAYA